MTFLLKPGELSLKKGNKAIFQRILLRNLTALLAGTSAQIQSRDGRIYVNCADEAAEQAESAFSHLSGITGWARARTAEKTENAVIAACVEEARLCFEEGAKSFKFESRRTDKSFPLTSYKLNCAAGEAVLNALPNFKVNVKNPDVKICVEIRERAFIYGKEKPALRGLPVGSAGRGLLLLSGGIDSPVAGFLMLLRGLRLNAIYFHAYPYTSNEAKQKAVMLAALLRRYSINLKLFVANFASVQQRIKERAPEAWATILLRMAMMEMASMVARREKCACLVTGESLSQVASQTVENIASTQSRATLPVLRPLIGMDKESIIKKAVKIGSYPISILPYTDCCSIFSPEHPVLHSRTDEAARLYSALELDFSKIELETPAI
ncbi:MAG: tRNA 4-thiouridine(8) synthase ThiI [Spirochaetaceae bacterium]|jgi:thiamine biosynthesis protein ThiI|nr:tRNA 4-thiouridine(8) synthase ThiI [Spirochaetaceae bacterium]